MAFYDLHIMRAFGGISVAHYTYFISCVRHCVERCGLLVFCLRKKLNSIYPLTNGVFIAFYSLIERQILYVFMCFYIVIKLIEINAFKYRIFRA